MKILKIFLIYFIICLPTALVFAQWIWLTPVPTSFHLNGLYFLNNDTGFVVGASGNLEGILLKTTNAGNNWVSLLEGFSSEMSSVLFINSNTGFVVGGNPGSSVILKTTDSGQNWTSQFFGPSNRWFWKVTFPSLDTGYVVGYYRGQLIYKTTNQGLNWFNIEPDNPPEHLHDVYFINNNTGFVVGWGGGVYKTVNGGNTWGFDSLPNSSFLALSTVLFVNNNTGFTAGSGTPGNRIFKTTNTGNNWNLISFTYWEYSMDVIFFPSLNTGYIIGDRGIYKTVNQGSDWSFTPAAWVHTDIFFVNNNTGYVCGTQGRLIKTTTGGGNIVNVINSSTTKPDKSILFDNYPNPFNPDTRITYYLNKESYVNLYLYDITGKEILRLVNNKIQTQGNYDVYFDGISYSSGIYFYRLEALDMTNNRFTETKKMVMIK